MVESLPQCGRPELDPWVGKIPWRRKWQPTPVFWLGYSHGQRSLVGYSPRGNKESDTTEGLTRNTVHLQVNFSLFSGLAMLPLHLYDVSYYLHGKSLESKPDLPIWKVGEEKDTLHAPEGQAWPAVRELCFPERIPASPSAGSSPQIR